MCKYATIFAHGEMTMKTYRFKLSIAATVGCIAGILLGLAGIGVTAYRIWKYGFSSAQLIIQHVVVLLVSALAVALFASILIRSVYKLTDKELILWFGFIKSTYKLSDIESIRLFSKTNKLVHYLKDDKYTVIVVKPEWYRDLTKEILARNKNIRYDVSTSDRDDDGEV